jgi:hypothetical protein
MSNEIPIVDPPADVLRAVSEIDNEILIYDALIAIMENARIIADVINAVRKDAARRRAHKAYVDGVYSPAIKLQLALGPEAMARGKARHNKIREQSKAYLTMRMSEENAKNKEQQ